MLKKPVKILMYLAMGILLMHSMVPHHHSEEDVHGFSIEQKESEERFSLVHFLEELFGVDLGDDHLENFQTSRGIDSLGSLFFLTPESSAFETELPVIYLQQDFVIPRSPTCYTSPQRPAFSLRGPPAVIR